MDPLEILNFDFDSDSEPEAAWEPQPQPHRSPPPPWESMEPQRRDPSKPLDEIETKLFKVFKNNHIIDDLQASQEMEMISTETICKKCLLFRNVCQVIGHEVKASEKAEHMKFRRNFR